MGQLMLGRSCPGFTQGHERVAREGVMHFFRTLWSDDRGQDATEYVLLIVLIALAIIAGMQVLATGINTGFNNAAVQLNGS